MPKYSDEFKMIVVRVYQEGKLGYLRLAKKHGVKSHKQIINWVKSYEKFGTEGIIKKKQNKTYSVQFKLDVLSFMKRTVFSNRNSPSIWANKSSYDNCLEENIFSWWC